MIPKHTQSPIIRLPTSLLAGLVGFTTIGCTNSTNSNPLPAPQTQSTAPIAASNRSSVEPPRTAIPIQSNDADNPAPASEVPPATVAPIKPAVQVAAADSNLNTDRPPESRSQAVNRLTNWFLNAVNPELNGRELTGDDQGYLHDRQAIQIAVEREMINEPLNCGGDQFWDLRDYGPGLANSKSLDQIAETIWANRDPVGANSRADVTREKRQALRASIMREPACY